MDVVKQRHPEGCHAPRHRRASEGLAIQKFPLRCACSIKWLAADGARLAGCLDLLRVPARQMWIEWNDEVHKRVIYETQSAADYDTAASGRRVGVLLQGSADGYAAVARTFWADAAGDESSDVIVSPLETHIDLRGEFAEATDVAAVLSGGFAQVTQQDDAAAAVLFNHVRFRF